MELTPGIFEHLLSQAPTVFVLLLVGWWLRQDAKALITQKDENQKLLLAAYFDLVHKVIDFQHELVQASSTTSKPLIAATLRDAELQAQLLKSPLG